MMHLVSSIKYWRCHLPLVSHLSFQTCRYKSKTTSTHSDYCMNLVQKSDYERYLSLLLLPSSSAKTSAFALAAFNVQIAQVFDVTKDRTITEMRLQFWRDTLELIYQHEPPEQPVAQELGRAVQRHQLSKHWLKRLIDGRTKYLNNRAFNSIDDVENYSENTVSSFLYLLLEILGVKNVNADHVASHIGKALGLVTLLRAVPYHGSQGEVHIPLYTLLEHQVSQEDIIRGSKEQKVKDVCYDIASSAHGHLQKARSLSKDIPKHVHTVFLCTVSLDRYLDSLQKVDFDVFDASLRRRNNLLPLQLMVRKWKGGF